ncbi:MAG: Holliday junction branch migration protein RuvA [Clostridia bacterium]|nr:Holliday junction branch migration protein RuvA [Clostridia bacterium]
MFYYLNGELAIRDINSCVIDCGGVGYQLTVSMITSEALASKVGQKVKLLTHLAVREDGVELFGFGSAEERNAFNMLIGVSGVGPKAAMNILSVLTPDRLAMAVCSEDVKSISKAPNVGAKTAARIVLELKDKVAKDMLPSSSKAKGATLGAIGAVSHVSGNMAEATEALMVLGYDRNTIIGAVKDIDPSTDTGEIIKLALKRLAK